MAVYWHNSFNQRPALNLHSLRSFSTRLSRRLGAAWAGSGHFDVTLAGDRETARLNREFRRKKEPADVLSFPWQDGTGSETADSCWPTEPAGFLGDIVISVESAARNAAVEGRSLQTEVEQLILHGALHLAGYDHEIDLGEMDALELRLRREFGIEG